jgi:hypothetical protein
MSGIQPKRRRYYFMNVTKVVKLARKIKSYIDSLPPNQHEMHYIELGKFLRKRLYQLPKQKTLADGSTHYLTSSLINQEHYSLNYQQWLSQCPSEDYQAIAEYLQAKVASIWCGQYQNMTTGPTYIHQIVRELPFYFDCQSMNYETPISEIIEDRVVVFYGFSKLSEVKRDSTRMAGYLRGCFDWTDKQTDKGHFIGHSLGACPRTATDLRERRFESVFAVFSGEYRYI